MPYWLVDWSKTVEKMPLQPAVLNHWVDCCAVDTAIRTRMTRTSSPAMRASSAKPRSPRRRPPESGRANPAGAGSAFVTVVITEKLTQEEVILLSWATADWSMLDGSGDRFS